MTTYVSSFTDSGTESGEWVRCLVIQGLPDHCLLQFALSRNDVYVLQIHNIDAGYFSIVPVLHVLGAVVCVRVRLGLATSQKALPSDGLMGIQMTCGTDGRQFQIMYNIKNGVVKCAP